MKEIAENKINVYSFPLSARHHHHHHHHAHSEQKESEFDFVRRLPFAVVGSNTIMEVAGKRIRGRKYPWGVVEVDNLEHCDFIALRNLLVGTHMQDMIETTNDILYENYRSERLQLVTQDIDAKTLQNSNPMEQIEKEHENREEKIRAMEIEMEQVFSSKVNEKEKKLLAAEKETSRKYEKTMQSLADTRKTVEEEMRKLKEERNELTALMAETGKKDKKHARK